LSAVYFFSRASRLEDPINHVWGHGTFQVALATVLSAAGLWLLAMLAASSIASEKQARTWPILLTIPLGADDILRIKVRTILRYAWPPLAALAVHLAWSMATLSLHPYGALGIAVTMVSGSLLVLGGGLYASLCCATPRQAKGWAVLVALAAWLVAPWLAGQTFLAGPESAFAYAASPVGMAQAFAAHYAADMGKEFPGGFGPLWLVAMSGAMANLIAAGVLFWRTGRRLRYSAFE
jgi:hypothetical protein